MATENLTLGRGKLYFQPYAPNQSTGGVRGYLGNTPTLSMAQAVTKLDHYSSEGGLKVKDRSVVLQTDVTLTFDTDHISAANLALWFGGNNTGDIPADAPPGVGSSVVIGSADQIFGSLLFESDNPVGENRNYWWPYVSLQPSGTMALKGDAWQTLSFSAEALKRDSTTERVYVFDPPSAAGSAKTDGTGYLTVGVVGTATGGEADAATGGTVTAPGTATHGTALTASFTLTGGDVAYAVLNNGTANEGTPAAVIGPSGSVSLTPEAAGTYTVELFANSAGTGTPLATSGSITVS